MIWILPALGVFVLLLLVRDVFVTVFVPGGQGGPLARRLHAGAWRMAMKAAGARTQRGAPGWLNAVGPVLVPLTFLVWGVLLVTGYALIYYPWADHFFVPAAARPLEDWVVVLYYSGYTATTLGIGDIYARGGGLRLVTIVEAAHGFTLLSVSISYLLSVYGVVTRTRSLALEIRQFIHPPGPAGIASTLASACRGEEQELVQWVGSRGSELATLVTLQSQYPLVHYFRSSDPEHALPLALGDLLESLTIARSLAAPDRFPALAEGPTIAAALRRGQDLVERGRAFSTLCSPASDVVDYKESYADAREWLTAWEIPLRKEPDAAERYMRFKAAWHAPLACIQSGLGYPVTERLQDGIGEGRAGKRAIHV